MNIPPSAGSRKPEKVEVDFRGDGKREDYIGPDRRRDRGGDATGRIVREIRETCGAHLPPKDRLGESVRYNPGPEGSAGDSTQARRDAVKRALDELYGN